MYAAALRQGAPSIPAGMLSAYSTTLYMPPVPPVEVVVEPWVDTDPVTVSGGRTRTAAEAIVCTVQPAAVLNLVISAFSRCHVAAQA